MMIADELLRGVPAAVREVCRSLTVAGHEAYVVGGGVRDLLLARSHPADWDVATSARPEAVLALFPRAIPTGLRHGTVTVVSDGLAVEVTTYRGEGDYSDGRRPDAVVFLDRIEDDLARRDFTINALALDLATGELADPFDGQADLAAAVIRTVGDPQARFGEDGLRPLRAVRFAAVLEFAIATETLAAIPGALPVFRRVAAERVRAELVKLLEARQPSLGLAPMDASGLLRATLPALGGAESALRARALARADAVPRAWVVRFAALHLELGDAAAVEAVSRLRPSQREQATTGALIRAQARLEEAAPEAASVRRALAAMGRAVVPEALSLREADLVVRPPAVPGREAAVLGLARQALAAGVPLEVGELALGGREVQAALGIGPGPQVGQALQALLEAVLEEPARNDPERLRALLRGRGPAQ